MKTALTAVLGFLFLSPACDLAGDYEVVIEVAGDSGIVFTGWFVTAYPEPDTTSASGTIPASWSATVRRGCGDRISAYFQKVAQPGRMTGRLVVDGDTVQEKTATSATDAVSLHWEPSS